MSDAGSSSSGDRDLLRRLLDETPDEATASTTRPPDPPPAPPPAPAGATFLIHDDDWDATGGRAALGQATAKASSVGQRGLAMAGPGLRHVADLALFALAAIGGIAGLAVLVFHVLNDPLADARTYYDAATRLNHGQALYPSSANPAAAGFYGLPPLLAIVLRPLALLPYEWFALAWEALVVAAFALLLWHLGLRSQRAWLAVGILGIPIGWAISIGQAQVPLTLLLALGQPWSIAVAANLGLFPALAALWWIGRRDGQATTAFVLWVTILGVAQALLVPSWTTSFVKTLGLDGGSAAASLSPYAASPELWLALLVVGIALTVALAPTRWGWPAAAALATLASPRLLVYMLMGLVATLREPVQANLPQPKPRPWTMVSGSGRH